MVNRSLQILGIRSYEVPLLGLVDRRAIALVCTMACNYIVTHMECVA